MRVNHSKRVRSRLTILAVCTLTAGWLAATQRPTVVSTPNAMGATAANSELNQLLTLRYETASNLLRLEQSRLQEGVTTLGRVCEIARWVRDSAIELPDGTIDRLNALSNYVALTRQLESNVEQAAASGATPTADREAARYLHLDAEVTLLRAKMNRHP